LSSKAEPEDRLEAQANNRIGRQPEDRSRRKPRFRSKGCRKVDRKRKLEI